MKKSTITMMKRQGLGTIVVLRNPINKKWVASLYIAPRPTKTVNPLEIKTHPNYILGKLAMALTLVSVILTFFVGCSDTTTSPNTTAQVETKYIRDSLTSFPSCYYPTVQDTTRDSLVIDGKHYTVSTRSRYRATSEPLDFGDTQGEGPVTLINTKFFNDTKTGLVIALNQCQK